ncbi:NusA-like transcription termination signal-binding factor [Candidatus Bathyarchaeota archaeon]|nr:MAG: NusA-like transcription termination signal-binding factor [Candidatus Bathyarchaeota archaeon B24-2]RJS83658.1 MAG: NusA-like transcription termination signal-binding factor [Candidatus Bathyarchaeota archaeon]RLI23418.1 MAG: NusA-like transcription termination signal-binding factor [Candidatus Bathyarchaeota archaeon]RLI23628.1 MAG: NusA-like transcription termination signal-binding factor [Candidatus Bathyarchaeota archaeon]HDN63044.1 NusA-like transcription termination signal-binding
MKYIALFESITGATVRDCIIDEEQNRIIFVVKEGEMGMAIGKRGKNMRILEKMTGKKYEIIEHSDRPVQFIKNALKPARVKEVRIMERPDGKTFAVISVDPKDKGVAIGKNGRNAERVRFLAKRYFQIDNVSII